MSTPLVELDRVAVHFPGPPPVDALRDASFTLADGEYVALTGPSGSGKSTLLNVMGLLARPTSGSYRLRGLDVGGLDERQRAGVRGSWLGTVFQAFHLLADRPALDNVLMAELYAGQPTGDRTGCRDRAADCLAQVGLSHRLGSSVTTLSGGERQRVAIARALFARPALLLCDEPTGNLDSAAAADVLDLFDELHAKGQTLMVITHSPQVAGRAQCPLGMLDGVVSEQP